MIVMMNLVLMEKKTAKLRHNLNDKDLIFMYMGFFLQSNIFLIFLMSGLHCSQKERVLKKTDFTKYELYFLGVCKKATISQSKLATRRTFFTPIIKKEDLLPGEFSDVAVVELRCKDGRVIQSFPEHGWFDIFYKNGTLEKIYVDDKKFGYAIRQKIEPDGFRKIFFRDGTYATKMPHDDRWVRSTDLRKGLHDFKTVINLH